MSNVTRHMRRPLAVVAALGVLLSLAPLATTVSVRGITAAEIRAKIKELEERERDLISYIASDNATIPLLDREDSVVIPAGMVGGIPIRRADFEKRMAVKLLMGEITVEQATTLVKFYSRARKTMQAELRKELPLLEQQLTKTRDDISYYLNELARLNELASPTGGRGVFKLVEIQKSPPCSTWGDITSCAPNGGAITWSGSYNTTYTWTVPPETIGPDGISISLSVSQSNPVERKVATGLGVKASGFVLDPSNPDIAVGAGDQPLSGNASVTVKPGTASGDAYLTIGVFWGPGFVYHYRAQP